ncbi:MULTISPECIES: hypothetical protein [Thermoactinomyces]|jgi:hypothetical protein|uniref:Uncharacterized protein n=1 Tax=Thermoactinomyces intermedius TaxID=2024 RepID=A0A8I1AGU3_THEIN|nr:MULTISPECIES: hypothetical protein [Thermoactinomyces]MBA4549271.1 hypothetical protein [Thermoactinomyces intermedius]MBH8595713.1 hypothetical protein [Thermoactinomyces intermedius]MBH8600516.1 hypothetical protein [Thermoactinomyces sp. CICC 23799]
MPRLKVKRRFRDRETFRFFNKGEYFEHESQERINELVDKGFLQGKPKTKKKDEESPEGKK